MINRVLSLSLLLVLLFVGYFSFVPYTKVDALLPEKNEGIVFETGNWNQILQKAKAMQKPIFLDVYATWCGPCKMLKSMTFPKKKAGEFYNANFINASIDGETREGRYLAALYKVNAYPTLLFLDSNGQVITGTAGFMPAGQLVNAGEVALKHYNSRK